MVSAMVAAARSHPAESACESSASSTNIVPRLSHAMWIAPLTGARN
jgi:hypothetical protein